jgi:hypothetical protein
MSTPPKPVIQLRRPPLPAVEAFVAGRSGQEAALAASSNGSEPSTQAAGQPGIRASGHPDAQDIDHLDTQVSKRLVGQVAERSDAQTAGHSAAEQADLRQGEVSRRSGTQTSKRSAPRAAKRSDVQSVGIVRRADGRVRRRLTVYLPVDVAKRLVVHCASTEIDISDVVTDAVHKALEGGDPVSE